jgi:hypothetical protein
VRTTVDLKSGFHIMGKEKKDEPINFASHLIKNGGQNPEWMTFFQFSEPSLAFF